MISITPEIENAVRQNAVVAFAVSGGKDGSLAALKFSKYLDEIEHTGDRVLIHSHLGSVEWFDSLRICRELSKTSGMELIVVKRKKGGMMQRWQSRWQNNQRRYGDLSCVKLILPWSTPDMRFCTSELKTAIIVRELHRRFKGKTIINVTGIRRAESAKRAKTPISKINKALTRNDGTIGFDYHPIAEMATKAVFDEHELFGFPLNLAYTLFGVSRVSCVFCIMSKLADLIAAAACEDNADIYREMCELELVSGFSFQSNVWLSDIAPHLLTEDQRNRISAAKELQKRRQEIEARIPKHLLYTKLFPECIPTFEEAELLCEIRAAVAELYGWKIGHTTPESLIGRYEELMAKKLKKEIEKKNAEERKQKRAVACAG